MVKSPEDGGVSCGICQSDGEPLNPALFAGKYFLQIFSILRHGVIGILCIKLQNSNFSKNILN